MSSPPTSNVTLEQAIKFLRQLPARERLKILVEEIAEVERETPETSAPVDSLEGLLEAYGPAPTAEEIDEARREMWGNFPRDDI